MSDTPGIKRQLKIKSGVAKRLFKEHNMYRAEAEENTKKLEKFKADGAGGDTEGGNEEWNIKNAQKVLDESYRSIKDSETRLGKAVGELRDLILSSKSKKELEQDEDLLNAESIIEEVSL